MSEKDVKIEKVELTNDKGEKKFVHPNVVEECKKVGWEVVGEKKAK